MYHYHSKKKSWGNDVTSGYEVTSDYVTDVTSGHVTDITSGHITSGDVTSGRTPFPNDDGLQFLNKVKY